jgi:hypothetical protein
LFSGIGAQYSGLSVSHDSLPAGTAALGTQLSLSVDVTNNGEYAHAHDEIVMVFARPTLRQTTGKGSDATRAAATVTEAMSVPRQMLLGFTRVSTMPGETVRATVEVATESMRLVGPGGSFELLHGDYELHVGGRAPGYAPSAQVATPLTRTLRVV